jgi:hypothetical protein
VTDRVSLEVGGPAEALEALREHTDYVAEELLAEQVTLDGTSADEAKTITVDGAEIRVRITKTE